MRGCLGVSKFYDWKRQNFEDCLMLISQYSSRQMVEKNETCTCMAVEMKIKIIKIVGEEKSHVLYSKSRHLLTTEEKRT